MSQHEFLNLLNSVIVPKLRKGKFFIAGGCFQQLIGKTVPKDIDIFFISEKELAEAKRDVTMFKNVTKTFSNEHVTNYTIAGLKVQFIEKYFYATAKECIDAFEYTISSACYDGNNFVCDDRFWEDTASKNLRLNSTKISNPASTLNRAFRFISRGYSIDPQTVEAIAQSIDKTDTWDIHSYFYFDELFMGDL